MPSPEHNDPKGPLNMTLSSLTIAFGIVSGAGFLYGMLSGAAIEKTLFFLASAGFMALSTESGRNNQNILRYLSFAAGIASGITAVVIPPSPS